MRIVSFVLVVLALSAVAHAQSRIEVERCRAIVDDARRLKCYDAIELSISAPRSKYQRVDLGEFKQFTLSYRGDLVEVTGWVSEAGGLLHLGSDEMDEDTIPIEYDSLPRRDRQDFLAACGAGCEATVQGLVRPVNFTTGIVAEVIIVH